MGYSQVPRIELSQDGTVTLFVNVGGFRVGTPVEISGHATQTNGAVATFRDIQLMPSGDPVEGVILVVRGVPVIGSTFTEDEPIMVVARAADVWIDKLHLDTGNQALSEAIMTAKALSGQANIRTGWNSDDKTYHSVYSPASWPAEPPSTTALLRGDKWPDRVKPDPLDVVMGGRYTKLFPDLPGAMFDQTDLKLLARAMIAPPEEPGQEVKDDPEENRTIPAAYTYLGQFIDHDLTFDPVSRLHESLTSTQLQALVDLRTPRLDLDNLYGRGPDDQPYMYEKDGVRMLLGEPMSGNPFDPGAVQLPRGPNRRALIGDPRNDENRIVAQLHSIFLRFHNKVVDQLGGKKNVSFQEVRQQVRWHYQWVLVNDFLRVILDEQTYRSVFPDPYRPVTTIPGLPEHGLDLMPVEFSAAAYRFGHSMVRPRYRLNATIERPIFSNAHGRTADLGGFRPIPAGWAIDWQFFIDLDHGAGPAAGGPQSGPFARKPQLSYKIDTSLVHPLGNLPARIARDPSSLALRNLERGVTFQLPSGQCVATALGLPVISDHELMIGKATADGPQTPITQIATGFAGNAPLWAYVLSEAQVTSWKDAGPRAAKDAIPVKLGPVGGRLVAEVFASLLRGDLTSYLYAKPAFVPIAGFTHRGTFGLAELINVALRPDE
jgi:heme peroxidase